MFSVAASLPWSQTLHTLKNLHRAGTFPNPNDWIWYPGRQVNFRKLMRIHPSEREAAVKLVVQPVGNLQLKDMWLCRAILWLLSVVFFKIKRKMWTSEVVHFKLFPDASCSMKDLWCETQTRDAGRDAEISDLIWGNILGLVLKCA